MQMSLMVFLMVSAVVAPCLMIDVGTEQLTTLAQLARRIPCRRNARPVHPSTVHRWRSPGIRGIRLECLKIGGAWHTSMEAFQRFCERLSQRDDPSDPIKPAPTYSRSIARAKHRQDQVERELDEELGV
jgi:hypothetical protein